MKIIRKLKFKSEIFKSCNKSTFYKFFYKFFRYVKMSKNLWAKDYQGNNERLLKKSSPKILKSFYKRKRKKQQYGCECYNILSENEKYELVGYRKICYIMRKNVLL